MSRDQASFGLGAVLAAALSWSQNHDIVLLIFHTWLSWVYVVFRVAERVFQ